MDAMNDTYEGTSYAVKIAPTGRAGCKGKCKGKIAKGAVKFVSISMRGDHPMEYARKIGCMTAAVVKNAVTRHGSIDNIPGMDHLDEDLAAKVKTALELIRDGQALTEELAELDAGVDEPQAEKKASKAEEGPKKTIAKKAKGKAPAAPTAAPCCVD